MIAPKSRASKSRRPSENGLNGDVLTLGETAQYLRVAEDEVVRLVQQQQLPGRLVGSEWRFLKAALQAWLGSPASQGSAEGIWALAGAWKDDPNVEEMLKEVYRKRGRPMTEEG